MTIKEFLSSLIEDKRATVSFVELELHCTICGGYWALTSTINARTEDWWVCPHCQGTGGGTTGACDERPEGDDGEDGS
jgi:Zn finger protein HypA/HybF involved in hydrogenase expression